MRRLVSVSSSLFYDFVLLSQRLRHYFWQRSRSRMSALMSGAFDACPRRIIRRLWPDPSSFFSDPGSVDSPVRFQIEMLDRPRRGVWLIVNANDVSQLQQSRLNWQSAIGPKARTIIPLKCYWNRTQLQRSNGQQMTGVVNGLNCAVDAS